MREVSALRGSVALAVAQSRSGQGAELGYAMSIFKIAQGGGHVSDMAPAQGDIGTRAARRPTMKRARPRPAWFFAAAAVWCRASTCLELMRR